MKITWSSTSDILATNIAAIAIAEWQHWPLVELLWPYWLQSVIIGWYTRRRVLSLRQFSLDENTVVQPSEAAEAIKRQGAGVFFLFYGFFHVLYLVILVDRTDYPATPLDLAVIAALGVAFLFAHRRSYARIIESDRAARPNILAALTLIPVMRVVPMHVTMIVGLELGGTGAVILFGTLKTLADVLMHWIEQRMTSAPTAKSPE